MAVYMICIVSIASRFFLLPLFLQIFLWILFKQLHQFILAQIAQ